MIPYLTKRTEGMCPLRRWASSLLTSVRLRHPEVNFTNILRASFLPIFFCQKITKPNCNYRKSVQNTFVLKSCSKNVGKIDTLRLPATIRRMTKMSFGKSYHSFRWGFEWLRCRTWCPWWWPRSPLGASKGSARSRPQCWQPSSICEQFD